MNGTRISLLSAADILEREFPDDPNSFAAALNFLTSVAWHQCLFEVFGFRADEAITSAIPHGLRSDLEIDPIAAPSKTDPNSYEAYARPRTALGSNFESYVWRDLRVEREAVENLRARFFDWVMARAPRTAITERHSEPKAEPPQPPLRPAPQPGRRKGEGQYVDADNRLVADALEIIADEGCSAWSAVSQLEDRIPGGGTTESNKRRLWLKVRTAQKKPEAGGL